MTEEASSASAFTSEVLVDPPGCSSSAQAALAPATLILWFLFQQLHLAGVELEEVPHGLCLVHNGSFIQINNYPAVRDLLWPLPGGIDLNRICHIEEGRAEVDRLPGTEHFPVDW